MIVVGGGGSIEGNYMLFFTREILAVTAIQLSCCLWGKTYNKSVFSCTSL